MYNSLKFGKVAKTGGYTVYSGSLSLLASYFW